MNLPAATRQNNIYLHACLLFAKCFKIYLKFEYLYFYHCTSLSFQFHTDSCLAAEFTCWDGTCIAENKHCDGIQDCSDDSDEYECGKFALACIKPGKEVVVVKKAFLNFLNTFWHFPFTRYPFQTKLATL